MKKEYDNRAFDIEILLISVVQGVALASLAPLAAPVIGDLKFEFYLYVVSSLIFIFAFWSQAIIHILSFIDWPLSLAHTFFYFLISFFEVVMFTEITSPQKWFIFSFIFFFIAAGLYMLDLQLIKSRKGVFQDSSEKKAIYEQMQTRQRYELQTFLPLALLYNLIAAMLIALFPATFLENHWHLLLIALQTGFGLYFLYDAVKSFQMRTELINKFISVKKSS